MATRKFGSLSKRAREQAVRAGSEYGLTRRQVRERYNRGTYNPFARKDPLQRIPREYRESAVSEAGTVAVDWKEAAERNYYRLLGPGSPQGETFKYNHDTVIYNVQHASDAVARAMAMATEDELRQWASLQPLPDGTSPIPDADELGYYDSGGSWNNIFWYH